MKRIDESSLWIMAGSLMWPMAAFADETAKLPAGYSGADYGWFAAIAVVLVYGVYDTFFKTP
jgi:hypothetical protein